MDTSLITVNRSGSVDSRGNISAASPAYRRGAELDVKAREIARQAIDGTRDEQLARWDIATLVLSYNLATLACRRFKKQREPTQVVSDMADSLEDLLIRKIVGDPEHTPTLDLER